MPLPPPDDLGGPTSSGIPTGWKATGPNPTPPARQLLDAAASSFASQLQPNDLRTVTGQGSCDSTLAVAAQGPCEVPTTEELTAAIPIYSTKLLDSYVLPVPGSPQPGTLSALTQVGNQNGVLSHVVQDSCDVPQQPFLSKLFEGPGTQIDAYGNIPIPDPANPGQALDAPGTVDKVVKGYRSSPRPERFKRPRFYPGPGVTFEPQIPPFDQPTLVQTVNNGSTLGDTAQRRWGMTYTDGTHESEMGPLSDWALGYLAASVTVPAVPAGAAWSHITAINLYRNTASDPETFKLAHSFGTGGGTIADTTADGSLGAAYTPVNTAIKAGGNSGAATYGVNNTSSGTVYGFGGTSSPTVLPWDTLIEGDDQYLDVSNPNALTIPADGDYHISTSLFWAFESVPTDLSTWAYDWQLRIWHLRGGVSVAGYNTYGGWDSFSSGEAFYNALQSVLAVTVAGAQAGDTVRVQLGMGAALGESSGWRLFYGDGGSNIWDVWVSIAPVG